MITREAGLRLDGRGLELNKAIAQVRDDGSLDQDENSGRGEKLSDS